ncbi:peroxiredoxin [Phenylobacterium koreense]|uniref:peroxiredoxin n=1 Tax=Phenylobacterium koreense TaxID=266125 RepID=UPI003F499772
MHEAVAGRREPGACPVAHEQSPTDLVFQQAHAGADSGLSQMEPLGRPDEAPGGDDLQEGFGKADIHRVSATFFILTGNSIHLLAYFEGRKLALHGRLEGRRGPRTETTMSLQLGQKAPDFEQDSTEGPISFHAWLGDAWGVLFSHPKDFTPVCTTELGAVARLKPEWSRRNVKPIALSVDPVDAHRAWAGDIAETQGQTLNYPVLADTDRKVAQIYDMIHPLSDPLLTVRAVYVIDPAKTIRMSLTYPPSTGRNFQEILRVIDALQLTDAEKVATPADWLPSEPAIIPPSLSDEAARERFPQGWTTLKPYLRMVQVS